MEHKAFIIYKSHCMIIKRLTNEQKWILFQQIIDYHESWEIYVEDQMVLMAFDFMKVNFDIDRDKYEDRCRINAGNGKLGGKAKASKWKRTLANGSKWTRVAPKEEENEYEEENKKIIKWKLEWLEEWTTRYEFFSFLLEHKYIEEEYTNDAIEKIDSKLKEFLTRLWKDKAILEIESFIEHHKKSDTVFKSTIGRLNTWLSNKL